MKKRWQISSWAVEWLQNEIAIVGYIYDHPKFKNGQKIKITLPTKSMVKYKYTPIYN